MIVIAGSVRLDPARMARAQGAMARMIEASRGEPGCLAYSYALDVLEPGLVRVFEVWRDEAAFEAHLGAPHLAEWRAAWPGIGLSDWALSRYDGAVGRLLTPPSR